jgi:hypothetical protein
MTAVERDVWELEREECMKHAMVVDDVDDSNNFDCNWGHWEAHLGKHHGIRHGQRHEGKKGERGNDRLWAVRGIGSKVLVVRLCSHSDLDAFAGEAEVGAGDNMKMVRGLAYPSDARLGSNQCQARI